MEGRRSGRGEEGVYRAQGGLLARGGGRKGVRVRWTTGGRGGRGVRSGLWRGGGGGLTCLGRKQHGWHTLCNRIMLAQAS